MANYPEGIDGRFAFGAIHGEVNMLHNRWRRGATALKYNKPATPRKCIYVQLHNMQGAQGSTEKQARKAR